MSQTVTPQFRITDARRSIPFYVAGLGFTIDWEHRFEPGAPVFMRVSRGELMLHLSEHFGDGTPGSIVYVYMTGVKALHRELNDKKYRHSRPGLMEQEWGMTEMSVADPFNNRITFGERTASAAA